jgi:plastocyanin
MRKAIMSGVIALGITLAAPVSAKTVTVAITHNGYVPKTTSIGTGDAVTFVNQDSVAHQVVLKPSTGFTCSAGLVLQPSQSSTCTFRVAGSYSVSDPNNKGGAFKGTLKVTGTTIAITLSAAPPAVTYGGKVTLSGSLASGQAGQRVTVLAVDCGATATAAKSVGVVMTTSGGAFSFAAQPSRNTTYQARFKNATSAAVLAKVKPKVKLRRIARGRFSVSAFAADSLAGKAVSIQRFVASTGRWVRVKTVFLKAGPTLTAPINPTIVSRTTFRSRIRLRLRVRAVLTQAQAGGCYAASRSGVIRS